MLKTLQRRSHYELACRRPGKKGETDLVEGSPNLNPRADHKRCSRYNKREGRGIWNVSHNMYVCIWHTAQTAATAAAVTGRKRHSNLSLEDNCGGICTRSQQGCVLGQRCPDPTLPDGDVRWWPHGGTVERKLGPTLMSVQSLASSGR